ncbi:peptidylprolyl isomerase [Thermophagus sp. OGC60D27]|uniref:peptidylprolyl isomerase n=1 Tax=Thermophagus sp. OGC60D27 TaxID=3458415 RepID=UPI00403796CD
MTLIVKLKKSLLPLLIVFLGLILVQCDNKPEKKVLIKTPYGNMKVKLYDDTPKHRDNFLKLVEEGFYDQLLFHRVINGFMIQGGDPESKDAAKDARLGSGGPGYTLPAEINYPTHFHKKGALAAARQGDQVNPEKKSSGSQFYIVQGKSYSNEELSSMEEQLAQRRLQSKMYEMLTPYQDTLMAMRQKNDREGFEALISQIEQRAKEALGDSASFSFPDQVREAYTSVGGTPFLDGEYTVFGEVIEGLDVIDSIASVATGAMDRPVDDMEMTMEIIEE